MHAGTVKVPNDEGDSGNNDVDEEGHLTTLVPAELRYEWVA